jgi:hypothetical protein
MKTYGGIELDLQIVYGLRGTNVDVDGKLILKCIQWWVVCGFHKRRGIS